MRYLKKKQLIANLEERLYENELAFESIKSTRITGMPSGGESKTIFDRYSDIEDMEDRINDHLKQARNLKIELYNILDKLDPREQQVLEMYFVDEMLVYEIKGKLHYSFSYTNKLYTRGVWHCHIPKSALTRDLLD